MKYLYASLMFAFCTYCKAQIKNESPNDVKIDTWNKRWKINDYKLPDVHTETTSQGVTIQNSYPKGDRYTDSNGKIFGVAIFWTRVINESAKPLQLTLNFSADSLSIPSWPDAYFKLFLPPDTMTLNKVYLYGYGLTDLRPLLDTGLNKPTSLQRTINPKEECIFYVIVVRDRVANPEPDTRRPTLHQPSGGVTRTALVVKEQDLFYTINIGPDFASIPCGQIAFKN